LTALLRALLLLLLPALSQAASLPLIESPSPLLPAPMMQLWQDPDGQADIEQVKQLPESAWHTVGRRDVSLGYSGAVYWLHFSVSNPSSQPIDWRLLIGNPLLDYLDAYGLDGERVYQGGDQRPFAKRWIEHRQLVLPIRLQAGEERDLWLRMQSDGAANLSASMMSAQQFERSEQMALLGQGLFFGALLAMLVYNLSIFLITKDRAYLWYCLFTGCFSLYQFIQLGFALQWLWPDSPNWQQLSFPLSSAAANFFAILFTHGLLELNSRHRAYTYVTRALLACCVLVIGLALFAPYRLALFGSFALLAASAGYGCITTLLRWHDGYAPAKLFALGWSTLIIASLFSVFSGTGLLPYSQLTLHAQQVGSLLELVIFSIVLAARIRQAQRAQQVTQSKLYANEYQLRLEQAKSLQLQRDISEGLESRVQERTASLQYALHELSSANQRLAELNRRDSLTGIFNRQVLNDELDRLLSQAKRSHQSLAILMMDLDHFKAINDQHGHLLGDVCLRHAAQRLQHRLRNNDLLVRFGGEEFVAVLCDTDPTGALELAEQLRLDLEENPCQHQDLSIPLTLSIGVYALQPEPEVAINRELLLRRADQALYRAKEEGRNRVVSFHSRTFAAS
jgi:diguanylate cyclase (GGDEF)-like protein